MVLYVGRTAEVMPNGDVDDENVSLESVIRILSTGADTPTTKDNVNNAKSFAGRHCMHLVSDANNNIGAPE